MEESVLSHGLKFSPTTKRIPIHEIIAAAEYGLSKVNQEDAKIVQLSVLVHLTRLGSFHPIYNTNNELSKDESILIYLSI